MRTYLCLPPALLMLACTGELATGEPPLPTGNASAGTENTFDHPDSNIDVWELLDRMKAEGPPRYAARMHGCAKLKYDTLGRLLASRGVDLAATGALSAGKLYRDGDQALGAPNFGARQRESRELTTATASKMFDIFVQAAPEIIAAMPTCRPARWPARARRCSTPTTSAPPMASPACSACPRRRATSSCATWP
jgi:hypothetical protein